MLQRVITVLTCLALTGCGTHVATPAPNPMLAGTRFETLRAKATTDPLLKQAVQDAAKKALSALDALQDAQLDPQLLNPELRGALADGQLTTDQARQLLIFGQLNTIFGVLANLVRTGKDDYSKALVAQLDAIGKTVKQFDQDRQAMTDEQSFKRLTEVVKQLQKALAAIAQ